MPFEIKTQRKEKMKKEEHVAGYWQRDHLPERLDGGEGQDEEGEAEVRVEKVSEQGGEGTGKGGVVVQNEVGAGGGGDGSRMGTEGVQRGFRSKASTGRWRPES